MIQFKGNTASMAGKVTGKVKRMDLMPSQPFEKGDILVHTMTNPDLVPMMQIAGAVVTAQGGRTCHAAIVSRELGVACIVACPGILELKNGQMVEVDTTEVIGVVTVL